MVRNRNANTGNTAKTTIGYIPLHDRVVILPIEGESMTKGGIIIPDSAKEAPAKGRVIAMGAGFKGEEMIVDLNDLVDYSKYAGTEIEIDGIKYKIMRESDIFGIYVPAPKAKTAKK